MSAPLRPWGVAPEASLTRDRLEVLERSPARGFVPVYFELVLEFPGGLYVNQETLRYPARSAFSVTAYRFTGDAPSTGGTTTSIQIRKISGDGLTVATAATITIAASTQRLGSTPLAIGYAANQDVQGNISAAGTSAVGYAITLECIEQ